MGQLYFFVLCLLPVFAVSCDTASEKTIAPSSVPLADPNILLYDGVYYAYGTNPDNQIGVYTSRNLRTWKTAHEALPTDGMWGEHLFWAPEVYYIKERGRFLMYYSSDDRICAAWSDSPLGPFVQDEKKTMLDERCVDNTLFMNDDGQAYIFFNKFDDGMTIWGAELENDLVTIRQETLTRCLCTTQTWEEVWPRVIEGAFVVKHKGIYYMIYSGNSHVSQYYGIGFATATSPLGPWTKYDQNPVLQKPGNLLGTGHSTLFRDKRGRLKIVFHAHHDDKGFHPRAMYTADISFSDDSIPVIHVSDVASARLK